MPAIRQYWPLVLETLKTTVSASSYKTWFSGVDFVSTANYGRKLILSVPSRLNKEYIEKKFKTELLEAISKYYPQVVHVDYKIDKKSEAKEEKLVQAEIIPVKKVEEIEELSELEKMESIGSYLPKKNLNNLNPKYSLEGFIVNSSNELAVSVAKSIIKNPGQSYNPVFLYSSTGMGKTHLLQAIGQKILDESPGLKIKYATIETFYNHFISSVQKNKGSEFRDYYRSMDVLLIDDIQFMRGKTATQDAFFHTFNELHQQNKQIVITSDRPPKSLDGLEDRLISRFEWGMVVDIQHPNLEDRISIFKYKLDQAKMMLSSEQIIEICKRVDTNIRDLEGVLNRIQARLKLLPDRELTPQDLAKILQGYSMSGIFTINIDDNLPVNSDDIIQVVSKICNVSKEDILGTSREKNIALARQLAMWFCKSELDLSFPTIGKIFGGKDHTTVMHAYQKLQKLQDDPRISVKISLIDQSLKSKTQKN